MLALNSAGRLISACWERGERAGRDTQKGEIGKEMGVSPFRLSPSYVTWGPPPVSARRGLPRLVLVRSLMTALNPRLALALFICRQRAAAPARGVASAWPAHHGRGGHRAPACAPGLQGRILVAHLGLAWAFPGGPICQRRVISSPFLPVSCGAYLLFPVVWGPGVGAWGP